MSESQPRKPRRRERLPKALRRWERRAIEPASFRNGTSGIALRRAPRTRILPNRNPPLSVCELCACFGIRRPYFEHPARRPGLSFFGSAQQSVKVANWRGFEDSEVSRIQMPVLPPTETLVWRACAETAVREPPLQQAIWLQSERPRRFKLSLIHRSNEG